MNFLKRLTASLLCVAMLAGTAACSSSDNSWAAKTNEKTIPIGVYIYYEYLAYQTASSKIEDSTKPVLEQKVENTDATEWIKKKALGYTKQLFVIDNKMKELKLSLTEAENKEISNTAASQWNNYKDTLEGYGISKESFTMATAELNAKSAKVFEALYGKKGSKAVSDADLKAYFEKSYTDFSYVYIPLYNPTTYAALDEKTQKEYKSFLEENAASLNKGSTTFDTVASETKKKLKLDTSPSQTVTTVLNEEAGYPTELITLINGMTPGEAKTITITSINAMLLVVRNDVTKKTATQLSGDATRTEVLSNMKQKEFEDEMTKLAEESKDITINQKAIDSYPPTKFVPKDNGSSSTAS
ncbi:MAG: hypothetical protein E7L17_13865 [Clostridium sp.]|uniref:hypothetical protein n=1 Tax=Clostridium sp. TaxID=1506 RepID=UPI002909B1E9|nr:hypothetical protein [Clostridium sp.]MDU7339187.1 hypothetical protein [Clostridium sp.]